MNAHLQEWREEARTEKNRDKYEGQMGRLKERNETKEHKFDDLNQKANQSEIQRSRLRQFCVCMCVFMCVCAYVNESQSLLAEWETEETYFLLIMIWIEDKLNQGSKYQTKLSLLPQNL